ncbi:MAG TPA: DUF4386 family protein [Steroidobacteraceae bacterium]|nr:DUF4386 family protein [Steroidobacteraceae bacterium]
MTRHLTPARWIAAAFLLQGVIGPVVNFGLLAPALSAPPGFLQNAASHAWDVQVATLLALVGAACSVGVGLVLLSVARAETARGLALIVLVLTVLAFAASVLEGTAIRGMLALSRAFHESGAADAGAYEPLRATLQAFRRNAHYIVLMLSCGAFIALYLCLLRLAWIPRLLAWAGVLSAVLSIGAALAPLLGGRIVFALLAPLGLCQLALIAWLFAARSANAVRTQEVHA